MIDPKHRDQKTRDREEANRGGKLFHEASMVFMCKIEGREIHEKTTLRYDATACIQDGAWKNCCAH